MAMSDDKTPQKTPSKKIDALELFSTLENLERNRLAAAASAALEFVETNSEQDRHTALMLLARCSEIREIRKRVQEQCYRVEG